MCVPQHTIVGRMLSGPAQFFNGDTAQQISEGARNIQNVEDANGAYKGPGADAGNSQLPGLFSLLDLPRIGVDKLKNLDAAPGMLPPLISAKPRGP